MSTSSFVKKKPVLVSLAIVLIIIAFLFILFSKQHNGSYHFKSKETDFTVDMPKGWTVTEEPRQSGDESCEANPDEGIKLLLNGNKNNSIWIYSQYGSISIPEENYVKEDFSTTQGIKGTLFKDQKSRNWQLVLNQDIISGSFGAAVNFESDEQFNSNQKDIVEILKSIQINKP